MSAGGWRGPWRAMSTSDGQRVPAGKIGRQRCADIGLLACPANDSRRLVAMYARSDKEKLGGAQCRYHRRLSVIQDA
jgi:hypothetical protein